MLKDLSFYVGKKLLDNFAQSFTDNVLKEKVIPKIGSVVYCELVFDITGHSGIYVGDDEVVHLDGSGEIQKVGTKEFLSRLDGLNSAISLYVSCRDNEPVGNKKIAQRANDMVGKNLDYNLLINNCHKFTTGCVTGDFENKNILLEDLKRTATQVLDVDNWLVWEI